MDFVKVKILFFGKAYELSGVKESYISVPSRISSTFLIDKIVERFGLQDISNIIILAINEEYISQEGQQELNLKEKDEIAVIPPISGGKI